VFEELSYGCAGITDAIWANWRLKRSSITWKRSNAAEPAAGMAPTVHRLASPVEHWASVRGMKAWGRNISCA